MRFTFLCIFLCLASISHGQRKDKPLQQFEYGVKAGANFSTLHIINSKEFYRESKVSSGRTSFHFGGFISVPVSNKSKLFGEFVYTKNGAVMNLIIGSYPPSVTEYKMDYLSIPILLRHVILNKVFVELGPQVSLLIVQNGYKKLDDKDFSVIAGTGYMITRQLIFNVRYNYGLRNINKYPNEDRIGKWYNRTIQVGFSYTFGSAD